jgi:hypothetical protein
MIPNVISHHDALLVHRGLKCETVIKRPWRNLLSSPSLPQSERRHKQPPATMRRAAQDTRSAENRENRRIPKAMAQLLLVMVSDFTLRVLPQGSTPGRFLFSSAPKRLHLTPLINGSFQFCAPLHSNQLLATRGSSKWVNIALSGSAKFTSNVETTSQNFLIYRQIAARVIRRVWPEETRVSISGVYSLCISPCILPPFDPRCAASPTTLIDGYQRTRREERKNRRGSREHTYSSCRRTVRDALTR